MDLYKALGIDKTATKEEVKKAYRKKALKAHPDAGGDKESFALISLAHDVLTDDARRARYDETGNTDDRKNNSLMQTVSEMAKAAFDEDRLDPVVFMKSHTADTLKKQRYEKDKALAHIKKLEKKLAKFLKSNATTKAEKAKHIIEVTMNAAIASYREFVATADANIELWESVKEFIDGLEKGPVEEGQSGSLYGFRPTYATSTWM